MNHVGQRNYTFFGSSFKTTPVPYMLFRPEEIHVTSGIWKVIEPLPKRSRCVCYDTFRFRTLQDAIFHFHVYRFSAIQTRSINPDNFSWKKPADRQRLETSLSKPLLLTVNGDAVLGRKVVEGGKRADMVGIGIQPTWKGRREKLLNCV